MALLKPIIYERKKEKSIAPVPKFMTDRRGGGVQPVKLSVYDRKNKHLLLNSSDDENPEQQSSSINAESDNENQNNSKHMDTNEMDASQTPLMIPENQEIAKEIANKTIKEIKNLHDFSKQRHKEETQIKHNLKHGLNHQRSKSADFSDAWTQLFKRIREFTNNKKRRRSMLLFRDNAERDRFTAQMDFFYDKTQKENENENENENEDETQSNNEETADQQPTQSEKKYTDNQKLNINLDNGDILFQNSNNDNQIVDLPSLSARQRRQSVSSLVKRFVVNLKKASQTPSPNQSAVLSARSTIANGNIDKSNNNSNILEQPNAVLEPTLDSSPFSKVIPESTPRLIPLESVENNFDNQENNTRTTKNGK